MQHSLARPEGLLQRCCERRCLLVRLETRSARRVPCSTVIAYGIEIGVDADMQRAGLMQRSVYGGWFLLCISGQRLLLTCVLDQNDFTGLDTSTEDQLFAVRRPLEADDDHAVKMRKLMQSAIL